jgi:hypothetical protein
VSYHIAAVVLCLWVLTRGVATTADLDWPFDPDHFRDIAHAQTIRDGAYLQDPFYRDELFWYNPLLPGIVAGLSYVTGLSVNVIATRAGAYLNLAAPLSLYLLVLRLTGPPAALASLVGFLFVVAAPTWAAPTYSPWLFGSVFAQPFFYLSLVQLHSAARTGYGSRYAAAGVLLGITFLAHTAPALLVFSIAGTITVAQIAMKRIAFRTALVNLALVAGPALIVALPFLWSIAGHYRLRVLNGVPLIWLDPNLPPDDAWKLVSLVAARPLLNAAIVAGFMAMWLRRVRPLAALIVCAWLVWSLAFFAYNNYVVPAWRQAGLPPMLPAHHFLLYERAAEMVLFGIGVSAAAAVPRWIAERVWNRRSTVPSAAAIEHTSLTVLLVAILAYSYPAFAARDAFGYERETARKQFSTDEQRRVIPWLRANTAPGEVVLTAEGSCLSFIGPAGRKCIVVPRFFANPYVDPAPRAAAQREMWAALTSGNCDLFREHARAYRVSYVMAVYGRTPGVYPDRCSLTSTTFDGPTIRIYRASWQ